MPVTGFEHLAITVSTACQITAEAMFSGHPHGRIAHQ